MQSFFNTKLFSLFGQVITAGQLTIAGMVCIGSIILYWLLSRKLLTLYFKRETIKTKPEKLVRVSFRYVFILLALMGVLWALDMDYPLYENIDTAIRISTILKGLLIFQLAKLADWAISKMLLYNYNKTRKDEAMSTDPAFIASQKPNNSSKTVQYLVYVFAVILVLENFQLDQTIFHFGGSNVKISSLFIAILVLLIANLLAWIITQLIMHTYYRKNEVNVGSQYAINQLLKYIVYVVAIFVAIETLGVKMTVVWGGLAALMVGVGLGLQQTFNDLFSGIILLFERTVEVGDVVEVGVLTGSVKRIGLRTSVIETRDNRTVFVPNSKLIMDNIVNWTDSDDKVRFVITVGAAYGSDTAVVKKLLLQAAKENIYVLEKPVPSVRFTNFGESELSFELLIWSRNFIVIEDIKSDLRFEIDRLFRENEITIPFPQRDVWLRK